MMSEFWTSCCSCSKEFKEGDKVYELIVGKYMAPGVDSDGTLEMTCVDCMDKRP